MRPFTRSFAKQMTVFGALMALQAIIWEAVRMNAAFNFVVTPWSLRGYEMTEGWVVFVLTAGLLAIALLSWIEVEGARAQLVAFALMAGAVLCAVIVTIAADPEPYTVTFNPVISWAAALAAAFVTVRIVLNLIARWVPVVRRQWWISPLSWIVLTLLVRFLVIQPMFVDDSTTIEVWVAVAVLTLPAMAHAAVAPPVELAGSRMLMLGTIGVWMTAALVAGPMRSTLLRRQVEEIGVSAQYRETQITWGLVLVWIGIGLVFFGAVAVWARRRDHLVTVRRARLQRAAAEQSLRELEEAQAS